MKQTQENLELELKKELTRVENFGRLVEQQDILLASGQLDQLPRIIERKDRIIKRLLEVKQKFESQKGGGAVVSGKTGSLWSEIKERLNKYAAVDKASLERAVEIRQDLARKLRRVKTGKKMLLGYSPHAEEGKARFRDIKT